MKNILLFLPLFFLSVVGFSQSVDENETPNDNLETAFKAKHGLGAAAGLTTSYGLSYRYYHKPMIFQVTFSPQVDDWETITNTGLTFMYKLVDKNKSSFYVYQSTFWRYESGSVSWSTGMPYIEKYQENMFNVGLGFGLEYIAAERFSLNLMTGYGAFDNFEQFSLSVEAGIFYLF